MFRTKMAEDPHDASPPLLSWQGSAQFSSLPRVHSREVSVALCFASLRVARRAREPHLSVQFPHKKTGRSVSVARPSLPRRVVYVHVS